ncbi:hypothetical protein D3C81_2012710 [compost metagenome]
MQPNLFVLCPAALLKSGFNFLQPFRSDTFAVVLDIKPQAAVRIQSTGDGDYSLADPVRKTMLEYILNNGLQNHLGHGNLQSSFLCINIQP